MVPYIFLHISTNVRKYATTLLAFSWIIGFCFGLSAILVGGCNAVLYQAVDLKPSFFSIISVLLLPMLISLLAVFAGQRWLIFPLAFLKALSFAYVGWSVVVTFGSAGWLVRLLLMFSDCASVPLLWWFWKRVLSSEFHAIFPAAVAVTVTLLGIGIIDFGVIAPFLVNLSL